MHIRTKPYMNSPNIILTYNFLQNIHSSGSLSISSPFFYSSRTMSSAENETLSNCIPIMTNLLTTLIITTFAPPNDLTSNSDTNFSIFIYIFCKTHYFCTFNYINICLNKRLTCSSTSRSCKQCPCATLSVSCQHDGNIIY